MNAVLQFFESDAMTLLVTVLLHSLWQGIAIAVVLGITLRLLAARNATPRYLVSLSALALVVLGGFVTWGILEIDAVGVPEEGGAIALEADGTHRSEEEVAARPAAAPASPQPGQQAGQTVLAGTFPWQRWAGILWVAGMVLMLIRAARSIRGAARVRRQCRPMDDPVLMRLIEGLKESLGITRRIQVVLAEQLDVPAVVGFIGPTLLLPAGIITTLTPDQTRMVIAHELAHIRRYDYLVNILQLIVEAIFFFNPAVWWISRQVRLEREACCDAEAVRITGEATDYAETLAGIATTLKSARTAPTAAAALHQKDEGALLSRVRRLVQPGHAPSFRVPWPSATLIFLGSALTLVALQQCTTTVVQATAQWLSPRERIERIVGLEKTHTLPEGSDFEYEKLEKVRVRGTLTTSDARALPEDWGYVHARTERRHASISHSLNVRGDVFEGKVTPGSIRICIDPPGYAPVILGPFDREPGGSLEDLEVALDPGFPVRLQVADEAGQGVPGAAVSTVFQREMMSARSRELVTDAAGVVIIENAALDLELRVSTRTAGYQYDERTYRLEQGMPVILPLRRARPVEGRVLSKASGAAIPEAWMSLATRSGFKNFTSDPRDDWARKHYPSWETDAEGRFSLDTLRDDCTYVLYVEAPDHDPILIEGVRAGQRPLEVSLAPPRVIECRILGDLSKLHRYRGKTRLGYRNPVRIGDTSYSASLKAVVSIQDGEGHVRIGHLLGARVTLEAPGGSLSIQAKEPGVYKSVIDLDNPEATQELSARNRKRTVVVKVHPPADSPTPEGKLRVDYVVPGTNGYRPFWLPLEDGKVEIEVVLPADKPGKFRYGPLYASGYWIADKSEIPVPAGEEPLVIEVEAQPAGAIFGTVLDARGQPCDEYHLTLLPVERPPTPGNIWPGNHESGSKDHKDGKFLLQAIPLGGVYRVVASGSRADSCARVMSDPITIDVARSVREITLKIPRGVDIPVLTVSEAGTPLPGTRISLHYSTPYSHGFGGADQSTDREGRHVFRGVNPDMPGSYRIEVRPNGPFRGSHVEPVLNGTLNTIVLGKGVALRGRVINDTRGEPLPRVKVELWPQHGQQAYKGIVEGQTDDEGRFVIEGLESGKYRINIRRTEPLGTTVKVDEQGRRWFTSPANRHEYVDLSSIDLDEEYEIRVMTDDDPRLHPER